MLNRAPSGLDWSLVSGGHGEINATSAKDLIIDLTWLNQTSVIRSFKPAGSKTAFTAIKYQTGARWGAINNATAGSGFVTVGGRASTVGAGGFSTGAGIGFLASAYGYAIDRIRQLEVVLPNGDLVIATKNNKYSDLFFALRGGNGQFGIVTTFWQEAVPEPKSARTAAYRIPYENIAQARADYVRFLNENKDPFAILNYVMIYTDVGTDSAYIREVLLPQYFEAPECAKQKSFNETYFPYLSSTEFESVHQNQLPYHLVSPATIDPSFAYGKRRGVYGPPVSSIDTAYLDEASLLFNNFIGDLLAKGDDPRLSTFTIEGDNPSKSGNLPASNADSAWPHAQAGFQTLFSPAWLSADSDGIVSSATVALNDLTLAQQAQTGVYLADYINYISPPTEVKKGRKGWKGTRYWGRNVARLSQIKQKYDPTCRFHSGPTFGSKGCIAKNLDTIF